MQIKLCFNVILFLGNISILLFSLYSTFTKPLDIIKIRKPQKKLKTFSFYFSPSLLFIFDLLKKLKLRTIEICEKFKRKILKNKNVVFIFCDNSVTKYELLVDHQHLSPMLCMWNLFECFVLFFSLRKK